MGVNWAHNALHLHIIGIGEHFVPCFPSGMGSETFFKLRADGYRGDLGKRSMGREPGHRRMFWSMTGLVCKGYQH